MKDKAIQRGKHSTAIKQNLKTVSLGTALRDLRFASTGGTGEGPEGFLFIFPDQVFGDVFRVRLKNCIVLTGIKLFRR